MVDFQKMVEELGLIQISDVGELTPVVDKVLSDNPKAVDDVLAYSNSSKKRKRKSKGARSFLLGRVMQITGGNANPKVVAEILVRRLGMNR